MSSATANLARVSPLNLTRVSPFLGMYTAASLHTGFSQKSPYWTRQSTHMDLSVNLHDLPTQPTWSCQVRH